MGTVAFCIALAAAAAAGTAGVVSAKSAQKDAEANADTLRKNAIASEEAANSAFRSGELQSRERMLKAAQAQGSSKVGLAGHGLMVGSGGGSTQDDIESTNENNMYSDVNIINENANNAVKKNQYDAYNARITAEHSLRQARRNVNAAWVNLGISVGTAAVGGAFMAAGSAATSAGATAIGAAQTTAQAGTTAGTTAGAIGASGTVVNTATSASTTATTLSQAASLISQGNSMMMIGSSIASIGGVGGTVLSAFQQDSARRSEIALQSEINRRKMVGVSNPFGTTSNTSIYGNQSTKSTTGLLVQ